MGDVAPSNPSVLMTYGSFISINGKERILRNPWWIFQGNTELVRLAPLW